MGHSLYSNFLCLNCADEANRHGYDDLGNRYCLKADGQTDSFFDPCETWRPCGEGATSCSFSCVHDTDTTSLLNQGFINCGKIKFS